MGGGQVEATREKRLRERDWTLGNEDEEEGCWWVSGEE